MKTLLSVFLFSLLLLGCTHPSAPAPSASVAATAFPSPGSPEAQSLPLEVAQQAMVDEMKKTGGDPDVSKEPLATDQGFEGQMLRSGSFVALGYMTSGSATLETKDGKSYVVFSDDFSTPNGPDVVVYLTKNAAATTREDIPSGILLSKLKSLQGKQVYEIPAGTDVSAYHSVSLHCRAFNVPWSYAPLN